MYRVRVPVQPGQEVRFPGRCVHCDRPALPGLTLRRRQGRVSRRIDAPLCTDCQAQLRRQSGEEERWMKLGWLATGLTFVALLLLLFLLLPGAFPWLLRLLLALAIAALASGGVFSAFHQRSLARALPAKRAIIASAAIDGFSWRTTTFAFADEGYGRQFATLNNLEEE